MRTWGIEQADGYLSVLEDRVASLEHQAGALDVDPALHLDRADAHTEILNQSPPCVYF